MKMILGAAALLLAMPAMAANASPIDLPGVTPPAPQISRGEVRFAQRGGGCWYAIMHCSRSRGDANRWSRQNGGQVIDTSSDEFPNFQRGYYCVVEGPMRSQSRAQDIARRWRNSGVSRDAYAKDSGC